MLETIPAWLNWLFDGVCLLTILLFYLANGRSSRLLFFLLGYGTVQSVIAYSGFYEVSNTLPPRILAFLLPAILLIIWGLNKKNFQWIKERRDQQMSTLLHIVRIPVEICLFYLFIHEAVPELMTFSGRNFDILSGFTAPLIVFLKWKNLISTFWLLAWNWICLALVLFILVNGALSAEIPIQMFAFDQPNLAVMYFPFVLLPAMVVPLVVYTHISDIMILRSSGVEK